MGAVGELFKQVGYLIPNVDKRRVDDVARLLDNTEGMAIQGAAGSTGPIYVPGSPTGNPRFFKLAGETNNANSWQNAGYFQYSDNGSTLVTQIDNAGYIFNEQGSDIDFKIEGDTDTTLFVLDAGSNVISMGSAVDNSYKLAITGGLVLKDANGLDITPGSDTDTDLITLNVGGAPKFWWDESEDNFALSKGLLVSSELGIATTAVPHGGVGAAKLAIEGTNDSTAGPHIQATTASDDYPLWSLYPWAHDQVFMGWDSYFDGTWKSSDAGSNYLIVKVTDKLIWRYDSGISAGSEITWNDGFSLDASGIVTFEGKVIIDHTSTEALLVRKNTDGGDVFTVDTTNKLVGVNTIQAGIPFTVKSLGGESNVFAVYNGDGTQIFRMVEDASKHGFMGAHNSGGAENSRIAGGSDSFLSALNSNVGIGIKTSIAAKLHVDQASSVGSIPVLKLDQGHTGFTIIEVGNNDAAVDLVIMELQTGSFPQFKWDQSEDHFWFNKGLRLGGDLVFLQASTISTIANDLNIAPAANTTIGDGGVTNYANFAGDGELTLFGTARVISQIPIDNANLGKGNTAPTQIIIGDYNSWEYDINDDTVFTFHVPHDWAVGTAITISIDWFIDQAYVTNSGEVKWQIVWAATPHDESEPLDGPTHTGTADTGDINIPAAAKTIKEDGLTIAGASLSIEDQVGITISRIALTDGNNPSGNVDPAIVDIHIQYIADKLGENT